MSVVKRWRLVPVPQHGSTHMRVEGPATDEPVEVCAVSEPAVRGMVCPPRAWVTVLPGVDVYVDDERSVKLIVRHGADGD